MKKISIAILVLISITLIGQNYPSYETIVNKFFNTYSFDNYNLLHFEKKPSGWGISIYNIEKEIYENSVVFWDIKTKKYNNLKFEKAKDIDDIENYTYQFLTGYYIRMYKIQPYFGYVGWEQDVIDKLKDKKDLSDTLINALARAYSTFSMNLLGDNTGFADKNTQFNLPYGENSMTDEQLSEFRKYQHKAIEQFERLEKQNPNFETFIGNISIKVSNEYITSFLNLLTYQNEEEARKELKPGLYNKIYINLAKEYLSSCEKNAILFTNGDNDTYPLLYVQAQYGYRTDIRIINLSLLNTDRYIDLEKRKILGSEPIKISLEHKDYKNTVNSVVTFNSDSAGKELSIKELIEWIKSDDEKTFSVNRNTKIKTLPSNFLSLEAPKQVILKNKVVDKQEQELITEKLLWDIPHSYITKSDLIVLDILLNNNWEKPIYYATTISRNNFLGLEHYFRFDGMVYKVVPVYSDLEYPKIGYINTNILYESLMKKYEFTKISDCKAVIGEMEEKTLRNNLNIFYRLSSAFIDEGDSAKAIEVLDKCLELYPNKDIEFDFYALLISENYYKLNRTEKARKILLTVFENQKIIIKTTQDDEKQKRAYAMIQYAQRITLNYKDEKTEKILMDYANDMYNH